MTARRLYPLRPLPELGGTASRSGLQGAVPYDVVPGATDDSGALPLPRSTKLAPATAITDRTFALWTARHRPTHVPHHSGTCVVRQQDQA
jgi:hypothetical protein